MNVKRSHRLMCDWHHSTSLRYEQRNDTAKLLSGGLTGKGPPLVNGRGLSRNTRPKETRSELRLSARHSLDILSLGALVAIDQFVVDLLTLL